jgi:hypothetical protein
MEPHKKPPSEVCVYLWGSIKPSFCLCWVGLAGSAGAQRPYQNPTSVQGSGLSSLLESNGEQQNRANWGWQDWRLPKLSKVHLLLLGLIGLSPPWCFTQTGKGPVCLCFPAREPNVTWVRDLTRTGRTKWHLEVWRNRGFFMPAGSAGYSPEVWILSTHVTGVIHLITSTCLAKLPVSAYVISVYMTNDKIAGFHIHHFLIHDSEQWETLMYVWKQVIGLEKKQKAFSRESQFSPVTRHNRCGEEKGENSREKGKYCKKNVNQYLKTSKFSITHQLFHFVLNCFLHHRYRVYTIRLKGKSNHIQLVTCFSWYSSSKILPYGNVYHIR